MSHNINPQIIADYLENYKDDLESLYKWEINPKSLLSLSEAMPGFESNKIISIFDQQIALRKFISEGLNSYSKDHDKIFRWIIGQWGRINGNENSTSDLINTVNPIQQEQSFERIASRSKVLSFLRPYEHVIYDTRVAYSLNWIILSKNAGDKYFPLPEGRNSRMKAFDICTLIRLKHIDNYKVIKNDRHERNLISKRDNELFIADKDAYRCLVDVVSAVHEILWKGQSERRELFYTEMLLFAIADTKVFEEITNTAKVNF